MHLQSTSTSCKVLHRNIVHFIWAKIATDHGRIPFSLSYPRVPPISDSITTNSILIVPKDLYRAQLYSSEACGSHNINQRLTANSILIVTTHGELNLYSRDLIITVDGGCGVGVTNASKRGAENAFVEILQGHWGNHGFS